MVRGQLWWWLLLAAFVLAVLNLVFNGWLFVLPSGLLFFASNALSMVLSIAAVVWSILDLLASYRTGRSVRAAVYVTSWVLAKPYSFAELTSVLASLADQLSILGTSV